MIIVMPEGETFGWYLDSPYDATNKFETYITKEVIQKIDNTYRTVKDKKEELSRACRWAVMVLCICLLATPTCLPQQDP
jgi:S-formylglutathione hydrolase FrmB